MRRVNFLRIVQKIILGACERGGCICEDELNQANDADTPKVEEPAQDPVVPVPIPSPLKS